MYLELIASVLSNSSAMMVPGSSKDSALVIVDNEEFSPTSQQSKVYRKVHRYLGVYEQSILIIIQT